MGDVYLQVNIYGWSLEKLLDQSVDLPLILKVGGLDNFSITEFHWKKTEHIHNDGDVVFEDETFALNTDELENKPPFCSTPRTSLLSPVPFPPVEASRISANPAKSIEWLSRQENTQETMTVMLETDVRETTMEVDFEKSQERTMDGKTPFTPSDNEQNEVIIKDHNEQNASFHSVSSSVSDELKETQNLQEVREHLEQGESCTFAVEKVGRNCNTTIQFEELKIQSSFDHNRKMSADVSMRVYEPLSAVRIDSTNQNLSEPLPDSSNLISSYLNAQDTELLEQSYSRENEENGIIRVEEEWRSPKEQLGKSKDTMHSIRCSFEGCGQSYNWMKKYGKTRLIDHVLRHVPEQKLKCSQCEFACKGIRKLRTHQSRVHEDVESEAMKHKNLTQKISENPQFMRVWNMCFPRELMSPFMRQDKNIRRTKRTTVNGARSLVIKMEHSF